MAKKNDGKRMEAKLQTALMELQKTCTAYVHRFYDTHSARNLLPNQPGDFMVLVPDKCLLIEVKSYGEDMTPSQFQARQLAKHILWRRAAHPSWFVIHNTSTDLVKIVDAREIEEFTVSGDPYTPLWVGDFSLITATTLKSLLF